MHTGVNIKFGRWLATSILTDLGALGMQ